MEKTGKLHFKSHLTDVLDIFSDFPDDFMADERDDSEPQERDLLFNA